MSAGHARCLVTINNADAQLKLALAACDNKMTVRDLEKAVKDFFNPKSIVKKQAPEQSLELKALANNMKRVFSTKVTILGNDKKGRIYIDYYNSDDLDRIHLLIDKLMR